MPDAHHLLLFVAAGLLLNLTPGPDVLCVTTQSLRAGFRAGAAAALGVAAGCFVHIVAAAAGVGALLAASGQAFLVLKLVGAAYLLWVGLRLLRHPGGVDIKSIATNDRITPAFGVKSFRATLNKPLARRASRLRAVCVVANPRHSCGYGCGLRLASHPAAERAPSRGLIQRCLKDAFLNGFWTNALNPKVALFFLAFVPQFIAPEAADKTRAFIALGLVFNANGLLVNLGWAAMAAWMRHGLGRAGHRLERATRALDRAAGVLFVAFGIKLANAAGPAS